MPPRPDPRLCTPSAGRATWQLFNTLVPYAALWVAMAWAAPRHGWAVVPLAVLAAGFLLRTFIIFHDCGHGSFVRSRRVNEWIGFVTGTLTFTPNVQWWGDHARHHASSGNLDRRGTGDIWTLTVKEYLEASRWRRFSYRLARNPVVLFVIAPLLMFAIDNRFPSRRANARERRSVHLTNVAIVLLAATLSMVMGFTTYLLIQTVVLAIAGAAGIWLFYVQHQFEGAYWERHDDWDYTNAALQGSSYYQLPKILQWFTGNIGFHHIHHWSPAVPNYRLEHAHRLEPAFHGIEPLTLLKSFETLRLRLWDETEKRFVGYPAARRRAG